MHRSYVSGKKTKDKITDAALKLFAEKGYHGTTMREIAALSGQKLFSITYHFNSKEQLYDAVIDHIIHGIKNTNVVLGGPDTSKDMGFAQLIMTAGNMVHGSLSTGATPNGRIILQEQYSPSPSFSKLSKGIIEPIQDGIARALAIAVGRPELADTREFQLHSHLIHSLMLSYRIFQGTLKSRLGLSEISEEEKLEFVKTAVFQVEWIVQGLRQKYKFGDEENA